MTGILMWAFFGVVVALLLNPGHCRDYASEAARALRRSEREREGMARAHDVSLAYMFGSPELRERIRRETKDPWWSRSSQRPA
jgi:hypothetical protein